MGFLRNLFGSQSSEVTQTVVRFTDQRPDAVLEIVGEAAYQDQIAKVASAMPGPEREAIVMREPTNRYDPNAIAVWIRLPDGVAYQVGYLSRENAIAYGPVMQAIAPRAIIAEAHLKFGWEGYRPGELIGVSLHLGSPGELAAELWLEGRRSTGTHAWTGKTVVFTGESGCYLLGVHVDKPGQMYLAQRAGCEVWPRVTKKTDLCVCGDPAHETGNLLKAEGYGVAVMRERDFWVAVGLPL